MTSFTDSEKVEYALKTTLNITMSKFGYAPFNETPAPPRVFPSNVMSKDLIKYGEGDVDENGAYVSGHSQSGNIDTTLTTYESVLKYYKIVCPVTKKVSKAQLSNVLGSTSSQNILGREILDIDFGYSGGGSGSATSSNFWTQPVNSNFHRLSFFRGHYIDENNSSDKFNYANTHYKGLNLVWNHIADGTDVSAAIDADGNGTDVTKIVPHLKLFLQVQTAFQIGADNKENQCFAHSMMKNMLGLDFKIPVQVNVGEVSGGDTVNASSTSDITGPGIASGNEWYTQSTAGTINFYAVGHSGTKVDNSKDPINYPLNSNAPLVTFLKYTGDHAGVGGLGGGGGGGSAFEPDMGAVRFKSGEILYDFTEHTFTTGGNTGRYGPQLQTVINAYSSTTWASNSSYFGTNGAGSQKWTVPETATYTITAYGADAVIAKGGKGAIITGDFLLKKGEVIEILCGQRPSPHNTNNHCGAGGSFVVRAPYNTVDSILVIAGGGGGGHNLSGTLTDDNIDKHAQPGTKAGSGTSYGTALQSGNNSQHDPNGGRHGGGGGQPSTGDANSPGVHGGAGGGGFLTNGESGVSSNIGGISYVNGGTGGNVGSNYYGGFGAGGSHGNSHGGGGGGYTGGGGGRDNPHIGGGGGSYNSGVNKVALWGQTDGWVGEGKVYIVKKTTVNYNNFTLNNRPIATGAAPLYNFDIHTFTPCKKTGKTGPTFDQCKEEYEPYWVTQSSHFDVTYGIQKWTVPESGTYKITACGAAGGFGGAGSIMRVGGKGALLSGEFDLTKGKVINIAVGQMGQIEPTYYHAPGGGGGGTFITQEPHNTIDSILIVAGGGSGAGQGVYGQNDGDSGHGRDAQTIEGYSDGRAGTRTGSYCSSGAGFTANGNGHQGTAPYGYTNNLTSSNVLKGGESTNHADDSDGGFGGGGFGELGPGGGGGFCGGNVSCSWSSSAEAYGGTSKMSDAARNTTFGHDTRVHSVSMNSAQPFSDELISEMLNSRPGYVIIEKLIAIAEIEGGIDGLTSDNGKIGIGTTTPKDKLHVKDGNIIIDKEWGYICWGNDTNTQGAIRSGTQDNLKPLQFMQSGAPTMTVKGPNVGIGTSDPNYLGSDEPTPDSTNFPYLSKPGSGATAPIKLDVRGSIELSPEDPANPDTGAYAPNIYFPANNAGQATGLVWRNYHTWSNGRDIRGGILFETHKGGYGYASGGIGFYTSYYNSGNSSYNNASEVTATCKMTIRGSGNVGIGTTNPGAPLEIYKKGHGGDEKGGAIILSRYVHGQDGVNNSSEPYRGSCIWHEYTDGNDCMMFASSGNANPYTLSPSMVLTMQGNVGIGTTSPGAKLEVNGTFRASYNTDNYCYLGRAFIGASGHTDYAGFGHLDCASSTSYGFMQGYHGWTYINCKTSTGIAFRINNTDKMRMDSAGNLGIGTTSPKERLDVGNGKICFQGGTFTGTCGLSYYYGTQSTERPVILFDTGGSTIIRSTDNNASDGIRFQIYGGSEKMFIKNNGYVGIGRDPSYMLDVNGSVRFANCIWTQNSSNYGSVVLTGEKDGGYWGIQLGDSSNQPKIMSSGSNIGFYFDGTNEWGFYCDINAGSYMYYNGSVKLKTISNGAEVDGELYVDNWVRPSGNHGLYFQTHGGGWYMTDSTWIRSYNGKPVYIDNWMCATRVQCNSTSRSGNYVLRAHHSHNIGFYTEAYLGSSGGVNTGTTYTEAASAWFSGDIHVTSEVFVASDRRTKKDIEDVPDHNALEIVRNIPCRYYNYVDPQRNSENKSIGFIAQEVLPILPTAITIKKDFLPNRLEFINIEEWIDIDESDKSEYYYKLKSNLTDISGVLHRFICEDISNNKEIILEEVGNEDGTFNFPSKFDKIFCYGTEVDDFHVLDKSKIFALYHSSIQEIDRLQQVDKAKIAELENKVVTLESELETIKQHLGI